MVSSGFTYIHKDVGADIAGVVVGGGPDVYVIERAQRCNLIFWAEIRSGIANP
jgi:hypothetical protein